MTATSLFPIPGPVLVPIAGRTDLLAVRRVFCVGRNYAVPGSRELSAGATDVATGARQSLASPVIVTAARRFKSRD